MYKKNGYFIFTSFVTYFTKTEYFIFLERYFVASFFVTYFNFPSFFVISPDTYCIIIYLGDDHLILRGGGLALLVGTDYLFSSRTRSENLFPGNSRTEYLFSTATIFLKSKKKKKKKNWGGGGVVSARVK